MTSNATQEIWSDDLLDRQEDAEFLQAFLDGKVAQRRATGRQGSYVLNVDAPWGGGKSFFLQRLGRQLEMTGHIVARVNAWKDDYQSDPFVAILAAIDEALAPFTKKKEPAKVWEKVKEGAAPIALRVAVGAGKTLIKKYVGAEVKELLDDLQADGTTVAEDALEAVADNVSVEIERVVDGTTSELIQAFTQRNRAIEDFRKRLSKAVETLSSSSTAPFYVLLDELDRCRPSYAIALLERVKHLFEVDGMVFVFATNVEQLQHSVAGSYGPGFNGLKYLRRFFERSYALRAPSVDSFVDAEMVHVDVAKLAAPSNDPATVIRAAARAYKMDLREIQQFIDLVGSVAAAWKHEMRLEVVTLCVLAIYFLRTGETDWEGAQKSIPKALLVKVSRRDDGAVAASNVFATMNEATKIIRNAMNLSDAAGTDYTQNYVSDVLSREWNGTGINPTRQSAFRSLGKLLSNAGRVLDPSKP